VSSPRLSGGGPPRAAGSSLGLGLLIGALLGGGLGFYAGRLTAPPEAAPGGQGEPAATGEGTPEAAAPDGGLVAAVPGIAPPPPAPARIRSLAVTLESSLYHSLGARLEGREADILSAHVGRLLVWWLDARRDVLRGDRLEVAWEPVAGPGEIRVLALRYHSQKTGKTYEAYQWKAPGSTYPRHYHPDGQEVEERLSPSPIGDYEQITELMNLGGRRHRGVDFKCDVGTPVSTPEAAVVGRVNWRTRGNGNCLELVYTHTGATATFLHLDRVLADIRPGRKLAAGTEVALSGNTGRSTAPHLHYELHDRAGRLVNPFDYHTRLRRRLEGEELEAFQRARGELERLLQGAAPAAEPTGASL
jgi:murein DD-endopeptidase MepM/ murein hydrolase activator NlpD